MALQREALDRALRNYKISFGIASAISAFLIQPRLDPLVAAGDAPIWLYYLTPSCIALLLIGLVVELITSVRSSNQISVRSAVLICILFGLLFTNLHRINSDRLVNRLNTYDTAEGLENLFRSRDPFVRALALETARHRGYSSDELSSLIQLSEKDPAPAVVLQLNLLKKSLSQH